MRWQMECPSAGEVVNIDNLKRDFSKSFSVVFDSSRVGLIDGFGGRPNLDSDQLRPAFVSTKLGVKLYGVVSLSGCPAVSGH